MRGADPGPAALPRSPVRIRPTLAVLSLASVSAALAVALLVPPVAQWPEYHQFADQRRLLGIARFADVASNLPFSLVGLMGLAWLARHGTAAFIEAHEAWPWRVYFGGLVLLGPASAYYHLAPDNQGLMLDRLAMGVTFMGWFAVHLAERVDVRLAVRTLPWLIVAAVASVLYWYASELAGRGDLRAWGYMQFWPVLLVWGLLAVAPARYTHTGDVLAVYACYALALLLEWLDRPIYELSGLISGHTLKHLIAAAGAAWALVWLMRRRPVGRA
ncbi:MAG: hypothetical protein RMK60_05260 [Burkholderiales bacterium]|nr:hypothetical protein [Burkholderiales bacterium]